MHELSIAQAVLAIALEHSGERRVSAVEVHVGHLRQVVPDALTFSFELVAQGTPAEGAALELVEIPAEGECRACGARTLLERFPFRCAGCGALDLEVVRGEELAVQSIELSGCRSGQGAAEAGPASQGDEVPV